MRYKNYGVEAQLPPLHSSEAAPDISINQIMEHVDSKNELWMLVDKDKAWFRTVVDVMGQVHAMLSNETEGLFDLQKQIRSQVVEMCQKSVPLSLSDDVGAKLNTICQNALNETSRKI